MEEYRYNVPELFSEVVVRHSERPAIQFDESTTVSYETLDEVSNQVARFFVERGVAAGDRVCICLEKTLVPYAVILGALKAGPTYFAIDPCNLLRRIESILEQCEPEMIFSEADLDFGERADSVVECEDWFDRFPPVEGYDASPVDTAHVDGSMPAYLMFTSGSTGTPKGAIISHDNLVHFAAWAQDEYDFTPEDRRTHLNPLYFDNSVFDMYSTFLSGGCLIPFDTEIMTNPAAIVARIEEMECSTWFSVPSLLMYLQVMKEIRREPLRSLRRIIFWGEGYPKVKLEQLFDELGDRTKLINVYGPTECTCICSSYVLSETDFENLEGLPTLGQLIPNFRGYLLDGDAETAPGKVGELCLGGPCVGLGYFYQKEQTESAFVQNPLNTAYQETIYRTGDLARCDPKDGKLYFVARADWQIKHQGYRIELEEIQHAFVSLDGVDEAAILHCIDAGQSRLIAVVASKTALDAKKTKARGCCVLAALHGARTNSHLGIHAQECEREDRPATLERGIRRGLTGRLKRRF